MTTNNESIPPKPSVSPTEEEFDLLKSIDEALVEVKYSNDPITNASLYLYHKIRSHYEARIKEANDQAYLLAKELSKAQGRLLQAEKVIDAARQAASQYDDDQKKLTLNWGLISVLGTYDAQMKDAPLSSEKETNPQPPVQPIDPPTKKKG